MAGSLLARIRARLEELQEEMQPEAGFDRRAYGYDDDSQDATFEGVDVEEEESPWRRPAAGAPAPEPHPDGTRESPRPPRGRMREAAEVVPPRAAPGPRASAARPEAFDPFAVRRGQAASGLRRDVPPPPPREAPAPGRSSASPPDGPLPASRGGERRGAPGTSRLQRLRRRIRHRDSLRELFLLREVIDRPVSLRRRPRAR